MPNIVFYVPDQTYSNWLALGKERNDLLRKRFRKQLEAILRHENAKNIQTVAK